MTAAVTFERFRKVFGPTVAVDGLDLPIPEGAIYGLLGPNGSGKTTCIRAICGLLRPTAGAVRVLDGDAHADRVRVRPRLGYMPQQAALYEDLTARENLEFFARGLSVPDPRPRAAALLELVGLEKRADDQVYGFSGGMKQRVSLACALLHEPPVLLLDEPTAGVDPLLRRRMWATFGELRARGATVIVSTNQLDEALHCDRLAVLREGRLLAEDTPGRCSTAAARGSRCGETAVRRRSSCATTSTSCRRCWRAAESTPCRSSATRSRT